MYGRVVSFGSHEGGEPIGIRAGDSPVEPGRGITAMNTQVVTGSVTHPAVAAIQETTSSELRINISKSEFLALQAERDQYQAQVQELRNAAESESRRWAEILDNAHEWADSHNLCERYDEFLEANGLPTRINDYDSSVTLQMTISLCTSGRNRDAAADEIDRQMIAEHLSYLPPAEIDKALWDYTVDTTEQI